MKKYRVIIGIFVFLMIVICSYFLLRYFVLNFYSNSYFSVDYRNEFWVITSTKKELTLTNEHDSFIHIQGNDFETSSDDLQTLYNEIEKEFRSTNSTYQLINQEETKVGKEYYLAYQYLYEFDDCETLFVIVIADDKLIRITYTASIYYFDDDLDSYYGIINSMKI